MSPELLRKVAIKIVSEESPEAIKELFRPKTLGGILLRNKDLLAEQLMGFNHTLEMELLYREVQAVQRWGNYETA